MPGRSRTSATLVGVALSFLVLLSLPSLAGAYVYWVASPNNSIGRAGIDGSAVDDNFIGGESPERGRGRRHAHLLVQPHGQHDRPRQA